MRQWIIVTIILTYCILDKQGVSDEGNHRVAYNAGNNADLNMLTKAWSRMERTIPNIGKRPIVKVVPLPGAASNSQVRLFCVL